MTETIQKIDAVCRQLDTAIMLWFRGGDSISIHSLACNAYQIIHDVNQHRRGRDLLYDSIVIKDEYRCKAIHHLKSSYNFFKHAKHDPDSTIDFNPDITPFFILFTIFGLELHRVKSNAVRSAFITYFCIHNPRILTDKGREVLIKNISAEQAENIKNMDRNQFFENYLMLWQKSSSRL